MTTNDDTYTVPSLDVVIGEWHEYARESSMDYDWMLAASNTEPPSQEAYDTATDYVEASYDAMLRAGGFETEDEYDAWLDLTLEDAWSGYEAEAEGDDE